jgi:translation initiation factor IF-2
LKRFKEDVKDVATGFECGVGIDDYDDIKVNDIIEVYKVVETKRTLES